jgi:hypothetical protein
VIRETHPVQADPFRLQNDIVNANHAAGRSRIGVHMKVNDDPSPAFGMSFFGLPEAFL